MSSDSDSIHVGPETIDPQTGHRFAGCPEAGAVVQFTGTVRNENQGAAVVELAYEAYREMAERDIARIVAAARSRWSILRTHTAHRTGMLAVGEAAVCVTIAAGHREEAFAACRYIIDELKKTTPIWKRETLTDGSARWVEESAPEGSSGA